MNQSPGSFFPGVGTLLSRGTASTHEYPQFAHS